MKCGHTTRMPGGVVRGLGQPCEVKSIKDRNVLLRRMHIKDLPPRHMPEWPMPDNNPRRYWGIPFARETWTREPINQEEHEPSGKEQQDDVATRIEADHLNISRHYIPGQPASSRATAQSTNAPNNQATAETADDMSELVSEAARPTSRNLASLDEEDDPFGFQDG